MKKTISFLILTLSAYLFLNVADAQQIQFPNLDKKKLVKETLLTYGDMMVLKKSYDLNGDFTPDIEAFHQIYLFGGAEKEVNPIPSRWHVYTKDGGYDVWGSRFYDPSRNFLYHLNPNECKCETSDIEGLMIQQIN